MLDAMQASRLCAPAFWALAWTQTCTSGVMVAQLMKSLPRDRLKSPPLKICFMALSSVTTVKTTSQRRVTCFNSATAAEFLRQVLSRLGLDIIHRTDLVATFLQAPGHIRPHPAHSDKSNLFSHKLFLSWSREKINLD